MSTKTPAKGHTTKHVHHKKHQQHHKKHHPVKHKQTAAKAPAHNVHAVAKPAAHAKPRGFAVGELLPVCAFEALAMSLRLAGQLVDDDEVAWLWELAGADPLGATAAAALDAARLHGLAGFRPRWERLERLGPVRLADEFRLPRRDDPALPLGPFEYLLAGDAHALILGIDVPGPHCVLATADGWWSWGELHHPWAARIEEAWAVSWS